MLSTVRGAYTYNDANGDPEGASNFRWFRNGVEIAGETGIEYSVLESDFGSTLSFEVTPVSAIGTPSIGRAVVGPPTPPVGNPMAQIPASRDATLIQDFAGELANGAGKFLYVGSTNQDRGARFRRALLYFDVASAIPADATIVDVTLVVQVTKDGGLSQLTELHLVSENWGEGSSVGFPPIDTGDVEPGEAAGGQASQGDATWRYRYYSSTPWTNLGGDFNPTASATAVINGLGTFTYNDPQMVADVESWLAQATPNYGYILIGDESVAKTAKQIDGRDSGANSPHLDVEYILPR